MQFLKKITFVVLMFLCQKSIAQNEEIPKPLDYFPRYELGVQGTQLVRQLLSLGSSTVTSVNPYLLNIKHRSRKSPNRFSRFGFGLNFEAGRTFVNSTTNLLNSLDLRIGSEKRFRFNERLNVNYGWDFVIGFANNSTLNNGFSDFSSSEIKIGFGPILGIEYALMKNFKIGTESNAYLLWRSLFINSGFSNDQRRNLNFTFSPPAVLFLTFVFNDREKKLAKPEKYKYDYEEYDNKKIRDFSFKSKK